MYPVAVLHIPHSSTIIPPDIRRRFLIKDALIHRELLRLTHWYTDELFALSPSLALSFRFPISRLVVDPERFVEDNQEVMASRGMGVIYTRTSDGHILRAPPSDEEKNALIKQYYNPHHASISKAVSSVLEQCGSCLIIDCHSFPSRPLPIDLDQDPKRPDICIGTDSFHTPDWLYELAKDLFSRRNLSVEKNRPYSGTFVPGEFFHQNSSVCSIMIEVNRRLYFDEASGEKLATFSEKAELIQAALERMIDEFRLRLGSGVALAL